MSSLPPPPPPGAGSGPSSPPPPPPPYGMPSNYAAPAPAGAGYYRVGRIARVITVLLGIVIAFQIVSIPVSMALHQKARDFLDGRIDATKFDDALKSAQGALGFQGGAQIAVAVLMIIWMYRVAMNHRALGRPNSTWAPGWAIGGWFVPPGFVLAVPWLMLKELWKGSDPANVRDDPSWKQRPVSPWIHVWWVTFGFGVPIVGVVAGGFLGTNTSFSDMVNHSTEHAAKAYTDLLAWQFVSTGLTIIAAVAFIRIVRDLTARQRALTGGV